MVKTQIETEIPIIYIRHKEIRQALKCTHCYKWGPHVIDKVQVKCPYCREEQTKDLTKKEEDEVVNEDSIKDHVWMVIKEFRKHNEVILKIRANENYKIRFFEDMFKKLDCKIELLREYKNTETDNYTQYGKFEEYRLYKTDRLIYNTEG